MYTLIPASHQEAQKPVHETDDLETRVQQRMQRSAYPELHRVTCTARDGVVKLQGLLSSYYLCQVALAAVQEVDGVTTIDSRLEVVARHDPRERCYTY